MTKLADLQPRVVRLLGVAPEPLTDEQRRKKNYEHQKKWRDRNREKRNAMDRRWRKNRANNLGAHGPKQVSGEGETV